MPKTEDKMGSGWCYHCGELVDVVYDPIGAAFCYNCGNVIEVKK